MTTLEQVIASHDMEVVCTYCHRRMALSLGWVRDHREVTCTYCGQLVILGTATVRADVRNIERQLRSAHQQLTQRLK